MASPSHLPFTALIARRLAALSRRTLRASRLAQIGLVCGFWLAGEALVRAAGLPIPGSVIGMTIVLVLLASRRISIVSVRRGADWFLGDMLLFFVPAVLAVLDHRELLGVLGLKILAIIVLGTMIVMAVTAATVDLCYRWRASHGPADSVVD